MSKKTKTINKIEQLPTQNRERLNDLTSFAIGMQTQQNQIAQQGTAEANLRSYMITQNRYLLSRLYCEIGIVQTLIDQPVDDALSKLPDIVSKQLKAEDVEAVKQFIQEHNWFETFKQAVKWQRLFGGAGLLINTPQNPKSPLRIDRLHKDSKIELYALNRWELAYQVSGGSDIKNMTQGGEPASDTPYYIYDVGAVHESRILRFMGKEAPDFLKFQLMGWGMSEIERLIRSLNSFLKNQDVIFELIDEAKIDVYQLDGFQDAVMGGRDADVVKQVTAMNSIKNFLNALVMDKNDGFDQKQMTFAGLAEILVQIRQAICADLKMPEEKLWGIASSGLGNNQAAFENYNAMLESEIRIKNRQSLIMMFKIACQVTLGFIPEDIDLIYPTLQTLTAEQEENVKDKQFNRTMQAYSQGLLTEEQWADACNKNNLLPIEVKVDKKGILARIKDKMAGDKQAPQGKQEQPKGKK